MFSFISDASVLRDKDTQTFIQKNNIIESKNHFILLKHYTERIPICRHHVLLMHNMGDTLYTVYFHNTNCTYMYEAMSTWVTIYIYNYIATHITLYNAVHIAYYRVYSILLCI